jgi:cation diffusion facilitator family transporter
MTNHREITKTLTLAFFLNILVAAAKMVYGLMTGTLAMVSDGIHSFTDGFGSLMGIISVKYASRPSDHDHHYGHTKYETLGALGIATFVGLAGWEVAKQAIHKFLHPEIPTYHNVGLGIALGTIAINFLLSQYEKKKGEELNSPILKADAIHTASDIWVSLSVIVSLVAIKFGFYWVDTALSFCIALYFGYAAYSIVKENVMVLTDGAFFDVEKIKNIALKEQGVISCHRVRTRGTSSSAYVDLHIQVAPETTTIAAHRLAHNIENRIQKDFPGIIEVLVHTEPFPDDDED